MGTQPILRPPTRHASMSRAHFEVIARVLREYGQRHGVCMDALAEAFADALYPTNPRFDRGRFMRRALEVQS